MTTLPNMGLVLPVVGDSTGTWGDLLATIFGLIDAHTHQLGSGVRVPSEGLNLTTDLTFNGTGGIINLNRAAFAAIAALTSGSKALFVNTADNELYWRTNGGVNVKVTNGNALNVAAFAGGIGGDYTAVAAALNFDNSLLRYTFRQGGGTTWARIASGEVRISETSTTESVFVGLAAPAALASSYTITLPLAVPGSTSVVTMDSGGVLAATASPTFVDTTVTGRYKHPARSITYHVSAFQVDSLSTYVAFSQLGFITGFSAVCTVCCPVVLEVGKRITTYQQFYSINGTGATLTPRLRRMNLSTGTITDVANGTGDNTGAAGVIESQTMSSINHTVLSGEAYFIEVTATNAGHRVHGAIITYDDP